MVFFFYFATNRIDGWAMVFYATFINISVISWRSVLLLEETRIPRENQDLPSFIVGGNQNT
jgi:hypothetical protein